MIGNGGVIMGGQDLTAEVGGFEAMEEDQQGVVMEAIGRKDLWLDEGEQENLLDVADASIFYGDFPALPDFPCMSSSSSSSSAPAAAKPIAATSSSSSASSSSPAASWAVIRSDGEEDTGLRNFPQLNSSSGGDQVAKAESSAMSYTASMEIPPPSGLAGDDDCINVMEDFGCMDLIDCNELWDPSSVFQSESFPQQNFMEDQAAAEEVLGGGSQQNQNLSCEEENGDGFSSFLQGDSDMAMIFFEWLKQNKDYISAEDMRTIRLKRSTIESASKRLGNTEEGKKQLLKLILDWVEQCQLQKKRTRESGGPQSPYAYHETIQNPDPNLNYSSVPPDPNICFSASPWMAPAPEMVAAPPSYPPQPPPMVGYDPYSNPISATYSHSAEYMMMDHSQCWAPPPYRMQPQPQFRPFPESGNSTSHQQAFYGNPYQVFDPNGERLVRRLGSSATKEARKNRMARQRRLYSHHHHHHRHNNSSQNQNQIDDSNADGNENGADQASSPGNWPYWSPGSTSSPRPSSPPSGNIPISSSPTVQTQRQGPSDRRQQQSWKADKNLKFLLQKVLKQSDVGNLGRIVLPKKEAESHLPELESRDGLTIPMEDIGTSQIWNMRYRFWPNNKSRMYLLENTGEFVKVNGLQEGDFIVIYSDTKCGKYMIRGVKVRQGGTKSEGKKPSRRNNMRNLSGNSTKSSSLASLKQAVRCPM